MIIKCLFITDNPAESGAERGRQTSEKSLIKTLLKYGRRYKSCLVFSSCVRCMFCGTLHALKALTLPAATARGAGVIKLGCKELLSRAQNREGAFRRACRFFTRRERADREPRERERDGDSPRGLDDWVTAPPSAPLPAPRDRIDPGPRQNAHFVAARVHSALSPPLISCCVAFSGSSAYCLISQYLKHS